MKCLRCNNDMVKLIDGQAYYCKHCWYEDHLFEEYKILKEDSQLE